MKYIVTTTKYYRIEVEATTEQDAISEATLAAMDDWDCLLVEDLKAKKKLG